MSVCTENFGHGMPALQLRVAKVQGMVPLWLSPPSSSPVEGEKILGASRRGMTHHAPGLDSRVRGNDRRRCVPESDLGPAVSWAHRNAPLESHPSGRAEVRSRYGVDFSLPRWEGARGRGIRGGEVSLRAVLQAGRGEGAAIHGFVRSYGPTLRLLRRSTPRNDTLVLQERSS